MALLLLLFPLLATATCYYPNGTATTALKKICDPSTEFSACCSPDDICVSGGLCKNTYDAANNNWLWREQCTDQTWGSEGCPKYCQGEETADYASGQVWQVLDCGGGNYCCTFAKTDGTMTPNATSCCADEGRAFVLREVGGSSTSSSVGSSTTSSTATTSSSLTASATTTSATSAASSATSATPTSDSQDTDSKDKGLSIGVAVGAGVGAACGAVSLILIIITCFIRRKKKKKQNAVDSEGHAPIVDHSELGGYERRNFELGVDGHKVELGQEGPQKVEIGSEARSELPAFNTGPPAELGDTGRRGGWRK